MSSTAVSEVSLDPPTMLICVNRNAAIHKALEAGVSFCLNILNQYHEDIARVCGGGASGEARFETGAWEVSEEGIPRLSDAEATMICKQIHACTVGTHDVFIGEVQDVEISESCDPLVYLDGTYASASARTLPR